MVKESAKLSARPIDTIVLGGLAIGIMDMFDALLFFGWYLGIGVQPVFQSVAAGLLGLEAARGGGWNTWVLGLFLHYTVAFSIAAVYFLLTRIFPLVLRHPVVSGIIYGIGCHFFMQCVVIPFSAIGRWPTFSLKPTLNGIIGHAILVGLPVALIAAWSARKAARVKARI
ncbi:MAG: hypothetical protein ABI539_05880 [Acidobacteriota bacterium]